MQLIISVSKISCSGRRMLIGSGPVGSCLTCDVHLCHSLSFFFYTCHRPPRGSPFSQGTGHVQAYCRRHICGTRMSHLGVTLLFIYSIVQLTNDCFNVCFTVLALNLKLNIGTDKMSNYNFSIFLVLRHNE